MLILKAITTSFNRRLNDLSIVRKFLLIFITFSLIVLILLAVNYFGMTVLSDVRAYVTGEGLWSKAQKDAVYYLTRYLIYEDQEDYKSYLSYIQVPLGDRKARLELEKAEPDYVAVREGFIQGRNHPDDVDGMIQLFRRYYFVSYIADAIILWRQGDTLFTELTDLGEKIDKEVRTGKITPAKRGVYLAKINEINEKLTPIEDRFSFTLGSGARWLSKTLIILTIAVAVLLAALAFALFYRIARHLITEIENLQVAANWIAKGDFSQKIQVTSKDEIGDLASNFNEMQIQRQKAEEELIFRARDLNKANQQLLETERLKNNFFATVSHELRTPLTLILSPIESMLSKTTAKRDTPRLLKTVHNNTIRLLQLVNGLLDYSKLESGNMEVKQEPADLVEMTKSVLADFDPIMKQKKLHLQIDTNKKKMPVLIDRYLYERILFNLLSNAVKFTGPGGDISVFLTQTEDAVNLIVKDTGIGIPEEEQKNLFQKFRQIEGSSTRRFEGSGLGLALVKEFANLLGGTVTIKSAPKKGSTLTVSFIAPRIKNENAEIPVFPKTKQLIQEYDTAAPVNGETKGNLPKVLIAEDNEEMASYIAEILAPFCANKIAHDGEEALRLVHSWHPDLVLSDIMMPKKDGLELCREIRASQDAFGITVVLLTALTHRDALLKGWEAGADDYLLKPFHPMELSTRIRTLLSVATARKQMQEKTRQLNEELEKKVEERTKDLKTLNEDLQQFSFIASHDLREPIRKIRAFGDLLREEGGTLNETGKSYLERMQDASKRMEDLIGSLRTYSLIDREEEPFKNVDLNEVVKDVLSDLEIRIKEAGARIEIGPLPKVWAIPVQMGQLFQNLLTNALKFRVKERTTVIKIRQENGKIAVEDNGIGLEDRFVDQIFKPFQRLHPRHQYEGIGMGLAICQKIMLKHGGSIEVKSRLGEGTTFLLTLKGAA